MSKEIGYNIWRLIALLPLAAMAIVFGGPRAIMMITTSLLACVIADILLSVLPKFESDPIRSAAYGIIIVMIFPLSAPLWLPCAAAVALTVAMRLHKRFEIEEKINITACVWLVLMSVFAGIMRVFPTVSELGKLPLFATPSEFDTAHNLLTDIEANILPNVSAIDLILGKVAGGIGAVSLIAILLGGLILFLRGGANWQASVGMFAFICLLCAFTCPLSVPYAQHLLMQLSGGSLLFACLFIVPQNPMPTAARFKVMYGVLIGALIMIMRVIGFDEFATPFAIVFVSLFICPFEKILTPK